MPRSKNAVPSHRRRNKILKSAKGYRGGRSKLLRTARETVEKALQYAYRDRRKKKSDFRKLWITRINAAVRECGMSYSVFINGLKRNNIAIDRKMLAYIAIQDPKTFSKIAEKAQVKK
jgi:large subunit ribosomal protein L20